MEKKFVLVGSDLNTFLMYNLGLAIGSVAVRILFDGTFLIELSYDKNELWSKFYT